MTLPKDYFPNSPHGELRRIAATPRYCEHCGNRLVRKVFPSGDEALGRFAFRKFCDTSCAKGLAPVPPPVTAKTWQYRAACRDLGELFYPASEKDVESIEEAKAVCGLCPVFYLCEAEVIARPTAYGVWAGKTPEERAAAKRRAARLTQVDAA